jgi:hypothetical protein
MHTTCTWGEMIFASMVMHSDAPTVGYLRVCEDRRQKTEDKRKKTEDRSQKIGETREKAEERERQREKRRQKRRGHG